MLRSSEIDVPLYPLLVCCSPAHIEGDFVGARHVHFAPGVGGETIRIQVGPNWNVGIDNIDYTLHQVPEPASLTLVGMGLFGLLFVRERSA